MWQDQDLLDHIESASSISSRPLVTAEWNMNQPTNILRVGNYRYRPHEALTLSVADQSPYASLQNAFDPVDLGGFWTDATDADVTIDGGYSDSTKEVPALFKSKKDKENLLYSLEDCLGRFRPRSGVNKVRYLENSGQFLNSPNKNMASRPRFYMAHKDDKFKYWTSYRTEDQGEHGIANKTFGGRNYISDAAPFVVYKEQIPVNRVVVKMQTGVGDINLGPFQNNSGQFDDPFFGDNNRTVPERWSIQYLENGNWITAVAFNENSIRQDGSVVIGPDGYVEVYYGLVVPTRYPSFQHIGEFASSSALPLTAIDGHAYLIGATESNPGEYYVWSNNRYESFIPKYDWQLKEEGGQNDYGLVNDIVNPAKFVNPITSRVEYRELKYISGVRVVVETMVKNDSTFDLIEISPRLSVNLTDRVSSYELSKPASDLGQSGMPVGQLLAGTGSVSIFDYDRAFSENNASSVVGKYLSQNIQFKFYEIVEHPSGFDYFVPIKTMYSEGFPQVDSGNRMVSIVLRDLYFYFEDTEAPELFLRDVSLSFAICTLLDYVGFTNYAFKRIDNEGDPIIPSFFIKPNVSVAQVLQELALSTQSTMFFDEYNNFIVMSRNYMMPDVETRSTDLVLYGSSDSETQGAVRNKQTGNPANIIQISSEQKSIYNAGKISYTSRYVERDKTLSTALNKFSKDQAWVYKRSELWDISSVNSGARRQNGANLEGGYSLAAIPLASDLNDTLPYVSNNTIFNNVMDLGEGIFHLDRYSGYFYANGEVIRYDAVQYTIPGLLDSEDSIDGTTVWITNTKEYEKYFSKIPFNGKMYATGLVRIYTEPNYETVNGISRMKSGPVAKHGRCQFGTGARAEDGSTVPAYHSAGLNPYWSDNNNVRGLKLESKYLFTDELFASSRFQIVAISSTEGVATLTFNENHSIEVGEYVNVINTGEFFDGKHLVTAVGDNSLSYTTESADLEEVEVNVTSAAAYTVKFDDIESTAVAGEANVIGTRSRRTGVIKNYLSNYYLSESDKPRTYATEASISQASALVFSGGNYLSVESPINYLSYVYKPMTNSYKHFGTRMRIVGRLENDENRLQTPVGVMSYIGVSEPSPDQLATIGGASGGLSIMVDPAKNTGYYFEIAALTADNVTSYSNSSNIHDVMFYKVLGSEGKAIPVKLWSGYAGILVNSGEEIGQSRLAADENPTIYDLSIEYQDIGSKRRFYLFINNSLVQEIDDLDPLPIVNNAALFVRGSSRVMFENLYALTSNHSQNTAGKVNLPAQSVITNGGDISVDEAFRKYSLSGVIQSSYLSGLSPSEPPSHEIYYEEFGTIMREAAYFNVKYDKAYPALIANLSQSFSKLKGYTVSGFLAGPYGAEFLLFNATDSTLLLGDDQNSLKIVGVTFTGESRQDYTVDEYFNSRSDFSKPLVFDEQLVVSPDKIKEDYFVIKNSRMVHGRNEFNLDVPYLQTQEEAESLMGWLVSNIMKPRLAIGVELFANPMIQLGDIVTVSYADETGPVVIDDTTRFVVYNISYSRNENGPSMTLYLSEVG